MSPFQLCQHIVKEALGSDVKLNQIAHVAGGDINAAFRLETTHGIYFVKTNVDSSFPNMFSCEARGLSVLSEAGVSTPKVFASGVVNGSAYLLLEYLPETEADPLFWEKLGVQLAKLHRHSHNYFGLNHANYIGSLSQSNKRKIVWSDFFIKERLLPQIHLAKKAKLLSSEDGLCFDKFMVEIPNLFPKESPALLHGDLWRGNVLCTAGSEPLLIDPAIYYGHREMDLAMSALFGRFHPQFYSAYQELFPLEVGWEARLSYYSIYPLLVHLNLFGESYHASIKTILSQFQ